MKNIYIAVLAIITCAALICAWYASETHTDAAHIATYILIAIELIMIVAGCKMGYADEDEV